MTRYSALLLSVILAAGCTSEEVPLRKRELLFTQRKSKYNARRTHVESLWGRRINKTDGHENVERFLSIATSTTSTSTLADASTSTTDAATTSTTQADTTSAPTTTEAASTSTTEATPKTTSATKAASTSTTEATPTTSTTEDVSASTTETPKTSTVETTESTTFPPTKATTTTSAATTDLTTSIGSTSTIVPSDNVVVVDDTIEIESGSEPRMIDVIGNDYVMASGGSKLLASFAEVTEDLAFLSDQPVLMIKSVTEGSPYSPVSCEAMDNEVMIKVTDDSYVGGVSCYYTLVMRDSLGNEEIVDQQGTINIIVTPSITTTTTTTTTSTTSAETSCQDRGFYFVINADGSDGLCTNAVDSSVDGCNATQTGSGSGPCTLQSCCSIYQPSGDCQIFDNCNVVPTIVYVDDFPLFQPTGDVDKPATFSYDVLANDSIEDRKLGDFLVIDKVEGAFEFPLPHPAYDEAGNCVNCVDAGTCIAAKANYHDKFNTIIKYTAPSRFADKFKCRYTALIKRPQVQPDGTKTYATVRPYKTRVGYPTNHHSRDLQIIGPQPVPNPNFGSPQGAVGTMIGDVGNAPTDSPTTSPTKGPTKSPTISPSISPSISPTLNPTLSPTLFPTLYPTLYPTLFPTIEPTEEPTAPPPTELPTLSPVGVPVVPDVGAVVSVEGTTLIFVLDGAQPGVPLPNSLEVTDIVVQGIPATKRRKTLGALDMITGGTTAEGDGAAIEDKNIFLEEDVEVVIDIEAELEIEINGTVELELDINGTQSREADGSFCAVGPDGRSIQFVSGGTYVGPYRCTFETEDERGFIVLSDLNLDVVLFVDPPDVEPLPPKPPTPKPAAKPSWGGGYPQTPMPTHRPVKPWQPAWKPHWSAPEKPDYHEPHGPIFWGWGKSGKTKGTKTQKAGKSKSYKTFKEWGGSKSSKSRISNSKSSKTKSSKGMFTWWRGGLDANRGSELVFNKDGTAEGAAIKEEPLPATTNIEAASGSRSRGISFTLIASIMCSLPLLI